MKTGIFHPTSGAFLKRLLTMRIRAREVEAETAAQIALLQSCGLRLTHIDTHKHMHMFPGVLRPVLRAAARRESSRFATLLSLYGASTPPLTLPSCVVRR